MNHFTLNCSPFLKISCNIVIFFIPFDVIRLFVKFLFLDKKNTKKNFKNLIKICKIFYRACVEEFNYENINYSLLIDTIIPFSCYVKILLQKNKIKFYWQNNYALRSACENGYLETIKLLLNEKNVDPSADSNYPVRIASKKGYVKIFELLLNDKRVDPSANNNYAFRFACLYGRLEIVKLLLKDERVDPSDEYDEAFRYAVAGEHLEIVKLLLQDKRINPFACNHKSIECVVQKNNLEILKLLLSFSKFDSRCTNIAIQFAKHYQRYQLLNFLSDVKK